MSSSFEIMGSLALKSYDASPRLHVVEDGPSKSASLLNVLAMQMFGYLHGAECPSHVHELLDSPTSRVPLVSARERPFVALASIVAVCALFVLSFA